MKKEQIIFNQKGKAIGANKKDVYVGTSVDKNGKHRVQFSMSQKAVGLLDTEYVEVSNVLSFRGKRRVYFKPSDAGYGFKICHNSENSFLVCLSVDKNKFDTWKSISGKSYSIIFDTECNLFFIEV